MTTRREFFGLKFEWDENKAKTNWQKHGIRFETAAKAFKDENRMTQLDEKHSQEEERYITLAKAHDVLFVVHTQRGEEYIRLISARVAEPDEEAIYYGNRTLFPV